jgi:hypothetical protein
LLFTLKYANDGGSGNSMAEGENERQRFFRTRRVRSEMANSSRFMSGCPTLFGQQGITEEDLSYRGSRFSELRDALFENPYQSVWGAAGNDPLPIYEAKFSHAVCGFLPGGTPDQLRAASERTVDTQADLRWGQDRKGFRRIVHPNGICLFGLWKITEDNPYSGYFGNGRRGLVIARFSSNTVALRGQPKSLSLVGKIFPTTDEDHPEPLVPASFFTQEDFGNENTKYINDAALSNSPNVTALRRFPVGTLVLGRLGQVFKKVDKEPDIRQLHEISELGKPAEAKTNTPEFMRLEMTSGQARIEGEAIDFRDEIYAHIFDPGNPSPVRTLSFDIFVSNQGRTRRFTGAFKRVHIDRWQKIGQITFDNAVASYNGDHVVHFHHPRWRNDKNDPSTAVRVGGRRVK